jgi:hypothetical protein
MPEAVRPWAIWGLTLAAHRSISSGFARRAGCRSSSSQPPQTARSAWCACSRRAIAPSRARCWTECSRSWTSTKPAEGPAAMRELLTRPAQGETSVTDDSSQPPRADLRATSPRPWPPLSTPTFLIEQEPDRLRAGGGQVAWTACTALCGRKRAPGRTIGIASRLGRRRGLRAVTATLTSPWTASQREPASKPLKRAAPRESASTVCAGAPGGTSGSRYPGRGEARRVPPAQRCRVKFLRRPSAKGSRGGQTAAPQSTAGQRAIAAAGGHFAFPKRGKRGRDKRQGRSRVAR